MWVSRIVRCGPQSAVRSPTDLPGLGTRWAAPRPIWAGKGEICLYMPIKANPKPITWPRSDDEGPNPKICGCRSGSWRVPGRGPAYAPGRVRLRGRALDQRPAAPRDAYNRCDTPGARAAPATPGEERPGMRIWRVARASRGLQKATNDDTVDGVAPPRTYPWGLRTGGAGMSQARPATRQFIWCAQNGPGGLGHPGAGFGGSIVTWP